MATPTIQINEELDGFCSNGDLSEEAKRRYIAEAYERAQADYRGGHSDRGAEDPRAGREGALRDPLPDCRRRGGEGQILAPQAGRLQGRLRQPRPLRRGGSSRGVSKAPHARGAHAGPQAGRRLPREEAEGEKALGEVRRGQAGGQQRGSQARVRDGLRADEASRTDRPARRKPRRVM